MEKEILEKGIELQKDINKMARGITLIEEPISRDDAYPIFDAIRSANLFKEVKRLMREKLNDLEEKFEKL